LGHLKDEEHPPLVGGVWGFVDRNGKKLLTMKSSRYRNKRASVQLYQFKYNKRTRDFSFFLKKKKSNHQD
jgi:hypothetical protein